MKNTTKWYLSIAAVIGILGTAVAVGAATITYRTHRGDTIQTAAAALGETPAQFAISNPGAILQSGQTFSATSVTPTPTPVPPPAPSPTPPPPTGGTSMVVYDTYYGWYDNTPPGAETHICPNGTCAWDSAPAGTAGGDGTYANPITMATGMSNTGGNEVDDFKKGTIFYSPTLKAYFVVNDTCGDGNSPQTKACHVITDSGVTGTKTQLDIWIDGKDAGSQAKSDACEEGLTGTQTLIQNPASNLPVVAGTLYDRLCK